MSIAVLTQVYTEARRLAIAGSVVAPGDFRLKKLIPPLEQAGAQAPVFAKVAEAAKAVVEGSEATAAKSLLELTSLVNAILYTQGETGKAGPLEAVKTTTMGGSLVQTGARELKALLEALTHTGSGRLELVKDAHDRGLFRDLRLVKPAINAIDDPYPEIADFVVTRVLPMYGSAILPELRAKYDLKGTRGHPRRLKLMHALDPTSTRELVTTALETGSKEVKVAAIACLGSDPKDLDYLVEQSSAKAQEVRSAALHALAPLDQPEAVAVLKKAMTGKDLEIAAYAIAASKNPKLTDIVAAEIQSILAGLKTQKDKKKVGEAIGRMMRLHRSFPTSDHPVRNALLLDLFARRAELLTLKGDDHSGVDANESVVWAMSQGSEKVRAALFAAHTELTPVELGHAFDAARKTLSPAKLYDLFSPYLTAKVDEKKKVKDAASTRRQSIIDAIESPVLYSAYWHYEPEAESREKPVYDPRWLDLAVELRNVELVSALARPGHKASLVFAKTEFDAALQKAKSPEDLYSQLHLLFDLEHKDADDAFFAAMAIIPKKSKLQYFHNFYLRHSYPRFIPQMDKAAIPRLEELVASMPEREADYWLDAIEKLRTK